MGMRFLYLLCSCLFMVSSSGKGWCADAIPGFRLLPLPQKVSLIKGKGVAWSDLKFFLLKGGIGRPLVDEPLGSLAETNRSGNGVVELELSGDGDLPVSREGYKMEIRDGRVRIWSRDTLGLFYGCQTLVQLMQDARDGNRRIPACEITDYPDIAYRAVHWDLKYHLDNINYYYRAIDRLAQIKVNAVILEFEDKLRYRQEPEVSGHNAISVEEFSALTRYARARHIEISPLVQGLGHVSFILKHDKYKYLRDDPKSDWVIDPLNPETYRLQFSLYDDAMAATPGSRYLHVGGDEVYNLGKSALCKKSGMKPFELQMYWLNKVCKYVSDHGRIPIFWDDMVFSLSGLYGTMFSNKQEDSAWIEQQWKQKQGILDSNIALFPKNCIYMRWNYNFPRGIGNTNAIDWFLRHNLEAWGASAAQNMSAMLPREHSIFQPTKDFNQVAVERKMKGMLSTAWDDSSPHCETFWRGFYDFAALSWHYMETDHKEMHRSYRQRFYGPGLADAKFEFQDSLETALNFWDIAFMDRNYSDDRTHFPYDMKLMPLPEAGNPGAWSRQYAGRIDSAKMEIDRYQRIDQLIGTNLSLANRNHFSLRLFRAMNNLQVYSARLLLLLHDYDMVKGAQKAGARKAVIDFVSSFPEVRAQYESVFSETRFLEKAKGDILDQNNDPMLANGTANSDWMYVWELAMNDKIAEWAHE